MFRKFVSVNSYLPTDCTHTNIWIRNQSPESYLDQDFDENMFDKNL